jgi:hypothetical protein
LSLPRGYDRRAVAEYLLNDWQREAIEHGEGQLWLPLFEPHELDGLRRALLATGGPMRLVLTDHWISLEDAEATGFAVWRANGDVYPMVRGEVSEDPLRP